jgi:hypothetical protein
MKEKPNGKKKAKLKSQTANIRLLIIRYLVTAEHEKKSET